jgi:prepilin-type N-terminal cleavage/methylation domain-containing protein/prepilin-type processing-associated H-X9-DG protein
MCTCDDQRIRNAVPRRHHAAGFTLVELLVVIAIMSLLIGLLLPSLGAAKEAARKLVCLAQLRGIGITVPMYAMDYNDWLLMHGREPGGGEFYWFKKLHHYSGEPAGQTKYLSTPKDMFRCPTQDSSTWSYDDSPLFANGAEISYGWNYMLGDHGIPGPSGVVPPDRWRTTQINSPSSMVVIGETYGGGMPGLRGYLVDDRPDFYRFAIRHDLGGNVAWADSHGDYQYFDDMINKPELFQVPFN